jgi:hypothetical protein
VLGLPSRRTAFKISTRIGGRGESNRHNRRQELGDLDRA